MPGLIQHKRDTIHWRETKGLSGNMFALHPKPTMLLDGGSDVLRSFKAMGRGNSPNKETQFFYVHYDRDYVIEWLLQNVLGSFPGITHVQMRELFTDALKLRKERQEKGLNNDG